MWKSREKVGVICGSYGLLSKKLDELDSMIKSKQIPPAFTLLRRDGSRVDVNNKDVKFDLINQIFKHSYVSPDFVVVIEGLFADKRTRGHHVLSDQQIDYLASIPPTLALSLIPAEDIMNYKLNVCEEGEDILINRSIESFALKNLEAQVKREFAKGMTVAEPQLKMSIIDKLDELIAQVGIDPELLTFEQIQQLYHLLESEYEIN